MAKVVKVTRSGRSVGLVARESIEEFRKRDPALADLLDGIWGLIEGHQGHVVSTGLTLALANWIGRYSDEPERTAREACEMISGTVAGMVKDGGAMVVRDDD
jgi:hypothetical protein